MNKKILNWFHKLPFQDKKHFLEEILSKYRKWERLTLSFDTEESIDDFMDYLLSNNSHEYLENHLKQTQHNIQMLQEKATHLEKTIDTTIAKGIHH